MDGSFFHEVLMTQRAKLVVREIRPDFMESLAEAKIVLDSRLQGYPHAPGDRAYVVVWIAQDVDHAEVGGEFAPDLFY